ncbi:MAG: alpha-L-fucosidase [Abditibacteriota bacterium]|nr:alpha-L-fucosidase [Abditibacteriota bacterium]
MRDTKRVEWMSKGKFGLMVHYLIDPVGETPDEKTKFLNETVNNFDIDRFMSYIDACGADWFQFTIAQNTGYYIGPNEYIDSHIKGHTSERDLVHEFAKEMKKRGKHFLCYLPGETYSNCRNNPELYSVFKWDDSDPKKEAFCKCWEQVYRAYSQKFGTDCDGWWIDGCYDHHTNGLWDWSVFAEALRSGNPNSALAFSDGSFCIDSLYNISDENDFFPGEVTACQEGKIRMDPEVFGFAVDDKYKDYRVTPEGFCPTKYGVKKYTPDSKYIDGALAHALVPFDYLWAINDLETPWIKYPAEELIYLVKSFNDVGGAVTLNAPITMEGEIPEESLNKLIEVGKRI